MRWAIEVRGTVQGVGFRPAVVRLAAEIGIAGWVENTSSGVVIEAQGEHARLTAFCERLRQLPEPIVVESVLTRAIPERADDGFVIRVSEPTRREGPGSFPLSPDLVSCPQCMRELFDTGDRRLGHAFISCAQCGPRYSIASDLPYDRARTSLGGFELCDACRREYVQPEDRRYHAQTVCCPQCGPQLRWIELPAEALPERRHAAGAIVADPLEQAVAALRAGRIVALLGVGGFQLLVDATDDAGVERLRRRKLRPSKPLAVLFAGLDELRQHCRLDAREQRALTSSQGPIVLVEKRPHVARAVRHTLELSALVAPDSDRVGALLPTTALHALLACAVGRPLVCTSGNVSDEPLCVDLEEAVARLSAIADGFLVHDRAVLHAVDDSVAQVVGDELQLLRRARGYVPLATARLPELPSGRGVLAFGAHLKNAFALGFEGEATLGPHIGDLETSSARARLQTTVEQWLNLRRARIDVVACDLHTGYASTQLGQQLAARWGASVVHVQHHHAHVLAVVAEHGLPGPVFGLAWDGAGLGTDGMLWGGEGLLCEGLEVRRVVHLRPLALQGGSAAFRQPRRAALGVLHAIDDWPRQDYAGFGLAELGTLRAALQRDLNVVNTTSVGRLFDAAASLAGVLHVSEHEGHAATRWMELAERCRAEAGAYPLPIRHDGIVDWHPLFRALIEDVARGVAVEVVARRFHEAFAELAVAAAHRAGVEQVALAGGCFQNRLLVSRTAQRLRSAGFRCYAPLAVPANDGGLALGQVWYASRVLRSG